MWSFLENPLLTRIIKAGSNSERVCLLNIQNMFITEGKTPIEGVRFINIHHLPAEGAVSAENEAQRRQEGVREAKGHSKFPH